MFVRNEKEPVDIFCVLTANKIKLFKFSSEFKVQKPYEEFEEEKAAVVRDIDAIGKRSVASS